MADTDDILSRLPIDQIAARLGVDPNTVREAAGHALPALLHGMQANAQNPDGAASLAGALAQHDNDLGSHTADQIAADGDKIVGHVFGAQRSQVEDRLGGLGGSGGQELMARLLPMLAPFVMSFLARQVLGRRAPGGATSGGGLADVLGGLLRGGRSGSGGGIDLGGLLGGLLGGGRR